MKASDVQKSNKGFTIIEMLIVIGIFGVLTAVVVFQYGNFNSQTILTNMAYEVALATRQAQVYALGVRGQIDADNFDNRYGVYFNLIADEGDEKFIFFIDQETADSICDGDGETPGEDCFLCELGSECLESYQFLRDIRLDSICLSALNDPVDEDGNCDGELVDSATVTFERPNPDAIIYSDETSNDVSAAIFVKNQFDNKRAVVIKNTGQISVEFIQ
jgi:prepilin-type N-terminal cleavage/methylation domain-containing protein